MRWTSSNKFMSLFLVVIKGGDSDSAVDIVEDTKVTSKVTSTMSVCQTLITLIITCAYRCSSSWITGPTNLPRTDYEMAVGYDSTTNTVLLFGGYPDVRQFVTFNPDNNQFTDVNQSYLAVDQQTRGWGQHYSQTGNDLWIIRDEGEGFIKIDTTTYGVTDPGITISPAVAMSASLVTTPGFLIVIGGGNFNELSAVQIYNLGTSQWLTGVPSLPNARGTAASVIVNDKVYLIGGRGATNVITIQTSDISGLPTTIGLSWVAFPDTFTPDTFRCRAVAYGTDIYVIGGFNLDSGAIADVNLIDTISGTCEAIDTLSFETAGAPAIIVGNILYAFAGWGNPNWGNQGGNSGGMNLYQYLEMPTTNPTLSPRRYPSKNPTHAPSIDPTGNPSSNPTAPSNDPTINPTINPTETPSSAPSSSPTLQPLSFADILDDLDVDNGMESEMLVTLGLGSIGIFVLILALITRRSDDQDYEAVVLYILQCFDLYSDIILALLLYNFYLYSQSSDIILDDRQRHFLALLCWVSVLSVFVPYFLNLVAAIRIISKISRDKSIPSFTNDYFDSNASLYALGVLLNGGCYTALTFLNSKLFNLSCLNSGLSYYKLRQFEHFKILNTVVLENIPQITAQCLAFYEFRSQTSVVFGSTIWASFITSVLSLLLSIMVWCLRATGNNDYFRISLQLSILDAHHHTKHMLNDMDIDAIPPINKDQYDVDTYFMKMIENSRFRYILGMRIATHFGITSSNIQILSAYQSLQHQLQVNAIFRCNKHESQLYESNKLVRSAMCIGFVELLQNIYDIKGALLCFQMNVYPMDGTEDIEPIRRGTETEMDPHSLLKKWKLEMYWNVLQEHGFTEIAEWEYLMESADKLEKWGFKEGHIMQFKRKYKKRFEAEEDCALQIELQEAKEAREGDGMRGEGEAPNETALL
eukprot:62567_1